VPRPLPDPAAFDELVTTQRGVLARHQAESCGWTQGQINRHLTSGRWRALHRGVFVTHTGPVGWAARVWAALLHAGPAAVTSHRTAARLQGLLDEDPADVEVLVPWERRVQDRPGVVVRRTRNLAAYQHPSRTIPQTRVEHTVLHLAAISEDERDVVSWLLTACQRRRTTPERIAAALTTWSRHGRRRLILEVLSEAQDGVASTLERRYRRDVELPHGLPRGSLGEKVVVAARHWFADVRYRRCRTRVELEGLRWHPLDGRWRDDVRDNHAVLSGDVVLRFGWRSVVGDPCGTAAQVATVLRARGWNGQPRACRPGCPVGRPD
jgi:hypothetical protein